MDSNLHQCYLARDYVKGKRGRLEIRGFIPFALYLAQGQVRQDSFLSYYIYTFTVRVGLFSM